MIRTEHKNYTKNIEQHLIIEPNAFWNYIDKKKGGCLNNNEYIYRGERVHHSETAENFVKFFSSVYYIEKPSYRLDSLDDSGNCCHDVLNLNITAESDYNAAIKKLKPKKAAGVDGIPPYVIRGCQEWLKVPLLHIFNLILKTTSFPTA